MNKASEQMKNKKSSRDKNDVLEYALYLLALGCSLYYLLTEHVITRKVTNPLIAILILLFVRYLIEVRKVKISPILRLSFLVFMFMTYFLAFEFDFYWRIKHYDKFLHFLSGILFCFVGLSLFEHINRKETKINVSKGTVLLFMFFFSISTTCCWEILEFITDHFGFNAQRGSLTDTMLDLTNGALGALVGSIFMYKRIINIK